MKGLSFHMRQKAKPISDLSLSHCSISTEKENIGLSPGKLTSPGKSENQSSRMAFFTALKLFPKRGFFSGDVFTRIR